MNWRRWDRSESVLKELWVGRRGGRGVEVGGEVGEEVVVEDLGETVEEGGVDGGTAEDVVDVGAVAAELVSKP